jgi:PilZ domain
MRFRMKHRDQRSAPRRQTDWHGYYALPAQPTMQREPCRVLDVSRSGAALELHGATSVTRTGEEILVWLNPSDDGTSDPELRGRVRNLTHTKFGFVRVGVEFVTITLEERAWLRSLAERRSVAI